MSFAIFMIACSLCVIVYGEVVQLTRSEILEELEDIGRKVEKRTINSENYETTTNNAQLLQAMSEGSRTTPPSVQYSADSVCHFTQYVCETQELTGHCELVGSNRLPTCRSDQRTDPLNRECRNIYVQRLLARQRQTSATEE